MHVRAVLAVALAVAASVADAASSARPSARSGRPSLTDSVTSKPWSSTRAPTNPTESKRMFSHAPRKQKTSDVGLGASREQPLEVRESKNPFTSKRPRVPEAATALPVVLARGLGFGTNLSRKQSYSVPSRQDIVPSEFASDSVAAGKVTSLEDYHSATTAVVTEVTYRTKGYDGAKEGSTSGQKSFSADGYASIATGTTEPSSTARDETLSNKRNTKPSRRVSFFELMNQPNMRMSISGQRHLLDSMIITPSGIHFEWRGDREGHKVHGNQGNRTGENSTVKHEANDVETSVSWPETMRKNSSKSLQSFYSGNSTHSLSKNETLEESAPEGLAPHLKELLHASKNVGSLSEVYSDLHTTMPYAMEITTPIRKLNELKIPSFAIASTEKQNIFGTQDVYNARNNTSKADQFKFDSQGQTVLNFSLLPFENFQSSYQSSGKFFNSTIFVNVTPRLGSGPTDGYLATITKSGTDHVTGQMAPTSPDTTGAKKSVNSAVEFVQRVSTFPTLHFESSKKATQDYGSVKTETIGNTSTISLKESNMKLTMELPSYDASVNNISHEMATRSEEISSNGNVLQDLLVTKSNMKVTSENTHTGNDEKLHEFLSFDSGEKSTDREMLMTTTALKTSNHTGSSTDNDDKISSSHSSDRLFSTPPTHFAALLDYTMETTLRQPYFDKVPVPPEVLSGNDDVQQEKVSVNPIENEKKSSFTIAQLYSNESIRAPLKSIVITFEKPDLPLRDSSTESFVGQLSGHQEEPRVSGLMFGQQTTKITPNFTAAHLVYKTLSEKTTELSTAQRQKGTTPKLAKGETLKSPKKTMIITIEKNTKSYLNGTHRDDKSQPGSEHHSNEQKYRPPSPDSTRIPAFLRQPTKLNFPQMFLPTETTHQTVPTYNPLQKDAHKRIPQKTPKESLLKVTELADQTQGMTTSINKIEEGVNDRDKISVEVSISYRNETGSIVNETVHYDFRVKEAPMPTPLSFESVPPQSNALKILSDVITSPLSKLSAFKKLFHGFNPMQDDKKVSKLHYATISQMKGTDNSHEKKVTSMSMLDWTSPATMAPDIEYEQLQRTTNRLELNNTDMNQEISFNEPPTFTTNAINTTYEQQNSKRNNISESRSKNSGIEIVADGRSIVVFVESGDCSPEIVEKISNLEDGKRLNETEKIIIEMNCKASTIFDHTVGEALPFQTDGIPSMSDPPSTEMAEDFVQVTTDKRNDQRPPLISMFGVDHFQKKNQPEYGLQSDTLNTRTKRFTATLPIPTSPKKSKLSTPSTKNNDKIKAVSKSALKDPAKSRRATNVEQHKTISKAAVNTVTKQTNEEAYSAEEVALENRIDVTDEMNYPTSTISLKTSDVSSHKEKKTTPEDFDDLTLRIRNKQQLNEKQLHHSSLSDRLLTADELNNSLVAAGDTEKKASNFTLTSEKATKTIHLTRTTIPPVTDERSEGSLFRARTTEMFLDSADTKYHKFTSTPTQKKKFQKASSFTKTTISGYGLKSTNQEAELVEAPDNFTVTSTKQMKVVTEKIDDKSTEVLKGTSIETSTNPGTKKIVSQKYTSDFERDYVGLTPSKLVAVDQNSDITTTPLNPRNGDADSLSTRSDVSLNSSILPLWESDLKPTKKEAHTFSDSPKTTPLEKGAKQDLKVTPPSSQPISPDNRATKMERGAIPPSSPAASLTETVPVAAFTFSTSDGSLATHMRSIVRGRHLKVDVTETTDASKVTRGSQSIRQSSEARKHHPNTDECEYLCKPKYRPVCAQVGSITRTFNSLCDVKMEGCIAEEGTKIWYTGPCNKFKKKKTKVTIEEEEIIFDDGFDISTTLEPILDQINTKSDHEG